MSYNWIRGLSFVLMLGLAGCGGSGRLAAGLDGQGPLGEPRAGETRDVYLASRVDGETIAITLHEPTTFVPGMRYPLILHGHGYGGSRQRQRPAGGLMRLLLDNGYGVISIDQRGFGESGGTVRLFDPEFEGQDLIQIVDWAEENLDWLLYRNGRLMLGAIGGSYGGGFQHTLHALDPKGRLVALAPEITWHDLRYSLYSNRVFKSYWGTLLSAAGNLAGNQDQQINEGLVTALTLNEISDENLDLLYRVSLISHCEGNNPFTAGGALRRVDALYWQSSRDTLFNLNETFRNVACLRALGGDVRMLVKPNGHDGGGDDGGEHCGALDKNPTILAWFEEKLKGRAGAADFVPRHCFHLDTAGRDAVVTPALPEATGAYQIPATTLLALEGSPQQSSIPLFRAGVGGAVLAGVPRIQLTVRSALPGGLEPGDPVLFVGLARRAAGSSSDELVMANQVQPFRGYGRFEDELVGLTVRLAENDELRAVVMASHLPRYPASASLLPAPVTVEGVIALPLLPGDLPGPPAAP